MGFENERTREIEKLRLENEQCGQLIKQMGERVNVLRNELDAKDKLITSLKADRETLEKANLLLENNLRILHLSMEK